MIEWLARFIHRGLRQGDPLFSYLLILCAEGLSSLIREPGRHGVIHGNKVCRGAPSVTNLLFADDSFLFYWENDHECRVLKEILKRFEAAFGLAVNYQKSGIMFSDNMTNSVQNSVCDIFGVYEPLNIERYLGLPSLIGRSKKNPCLAS